jgi:DNA-binding protein H-NS
MNINLHSLSLKELKDLQSQVAKAIATFEDRKKKDALAALEATARDMGFSLAELTGTAPSSRKRRPSSVKYTNPANPSETWTGRGRKPRWFEAAVKAGTKPEAMAS